MVETMASWLKTLRALFILVILYALTGFFLAPRLLESQLDEKLGQQYSTQAIRFNPFLLKLEIQGFSLKGAPSKEIATFDKLMVKLQGIKSIKKRAWVTSVHLSNPRLDMEIDPAGHSNFAFLNKPSSSSAALPFYLTEFNIETGSLSFKDHGKGFEINLIPLNLKLENLTNQAGDPAHFLFSTPNQIEIQGTLSLAPLETEAVVKLTQIPLKPFSAYIPKPYLVREGTLSLVLNGRFDPDKLFEIQSGNLQIEQFKLDKDSLLFLEAKTINLDEISFQSQKLDLKSLQIGDLTIKEAVNQKPRVTFLKQINIANLTSSFKSSTLNIGSLSLIKPKFSAWLNAESKLGLPGFVSSKQTGADEGKPWAVNIRAVKLDDFSFAFDDETKTPTAQSYFESGMLKLDDFSLNKPFNFKLGAGLGNGRIESSGWIGIHPMACDMAVSISQLNVRRLQAYLEKLPQIDLVKGRLSLQGHLNYEKDHLHFLGQSNISDFASEDKSKANDFINWKNLKLEDIVFDNAPMRLSIKEVVADSPYAQMVIDQNGKLNITQNLSPAKLPSMPAGETAESPQDAAISINSIRVLNARTNFSDLSLKPTLFAIDIHDMNGSIQGLSSEAGAKAKVLLEGKINHDGLVNISGQMNPFKIGAFSDINAQFKNINMTNLSPYSGKFAGFRIEKGKLSMTLKYKLIDRKLSAENNITLDQLILGERVESSFATSLPVRFAIALLKDSSGKINLELPVTGDLSNPEFSVGNLYANALKQMITKLVRSPFSMLSSLVQSGGEDLGTVAFKPGEFSLSAEEKSKLSKLAQALRDRPNLNLEIKGVAHDNLDKPYLAKQGLDKQLKNAKLMEFRVIGEKKSDQDELNLSDEDYHRLLTALYKVKNPDMTDIPKILSGPAYDQALQQILDQWLVSELDLRILAQARGESIRKYLVRQAGFSDQKIYMLDVRLSDPGEKEIKAFLSLSGG